MIVMIHDVATKPSRARTKILPRQNGSNRSSIATEPCRRALLGDPPVHGQHAEKGQRTINRVASGERAPAASTAMPGRYDSVEK